MDYMELLKDREFHSPEEICEWMEEAKRAIRCLIVREETAEALVEKYSTEIVPRLMNLVESAEAERDRVRNVIASQANENALKNAKTIEFKARDLFPKEKEE